MPDDGFRYELVRGELRKMPYRGFLEGQVSASIAVLLGIHVKANRLGTVYVGGTGSCWSRTPTTSAHPARLSFDVSARNLL